ncbi:MAG TPA: hypothetical protein PLU25_08890, partial [Acidobacteriota bacterium]|nr:hypothetical protein [Acidobacteriota bacterium]
RPTKLAPLNLITSAQALSAIDHQPSTTDDQPSPVPEPANLEPANHRLRSRIASMNPQSPSIMHR